MKVYIFKLGGVDAWDYDWALSKYPVAKESECTQKILYTDRFGDYVLFNGSEEDARKFYSDYCRIHNLDLVLASS